MNSVDSFAARCYSEQCAEEKIEGLFLLLPFALWAFWVYVSRDYVKNDFLRVFINAGILLLIFIPYGAIDLYPIVALGVWFRITSLRVKTRWLRWTLNILVLLVLAVVF